MVKTETQTLISCKSFIEIKEKKPGNSYIENYIKKQQKQELN